MRTDTALGKRFALLILATIFLLAPFGCGEGRDTSPAAAPRDEAGGSPVPAGEAPGGGVDLDALLGDGLVSAEVTGRSIDKIDIRLTNSISRGSVISKADIAKAREIVSRVQGVS
jgi:hypothetical protein